MFKYIDLFAGMGGIRLGLEQALKEKGIEGKCVLTSEIKPYALEVYKENFGDENIVGDIREVQGCDIPDFDMLLAGFPCFTEDTLIYTESGYKYLRDISLNEKVLTIDNTFQSVSNIISKGKDKIVRLKGMSTSYIETTLNHPFFVRRKYYKYCKGKQVRCFEEPMWMSVEEILNTNELKNYYLSLPLNKESKIPKWDGVEININQSTKKKVCNLDMNDPKLWYIVGRYLGDGWLKKSRKGEFRSDIQGIIICCNPNEYEDLRMKIPNYFHYTLAKERTVYKLHFSNTELAHFCSRLGDGAGNKRIPKFIVDLPINLLKSFIEGYFDSDGHCDGKDYILEFTSISKQLIYDLSFCLLKVFKRPISIGYVKTKDLTKIEGRIVNQKDYYTVSVCTKSYGREEAFIEGDYYWFPLRKIVVTEEKKNVFDLTVENNHTFISENCIVHNCQSFSIAGKRMGFEDTRGTLFFEIARILRDKKPKYFLLENVENLIRHDLSKEDKKAGKTMGKTLETILNTLTDLGYKVSWKILAASDYGVAQIRKRIYIVGSLDKEISLENFEKKTVNFGEIQEYGKPCVDSHFTRCLFKYLKENNLPISHLYNKAIRDKRGSDNNIHSWTIGLRGEVSDVQKRLLDKMVPERRRVDYAKKKNMPIIEGIGLDMDELSLIYDGDNLEKDIKELISMGYVIEKNYDTWPKPCYDVIGGRLSYEFTKIFDPNKPALTLVATEVGKNAVVDGNGIRKLTIKEGLRLNGYPDDYKLNLDYRKAMDLLGNTVVVPIIKMICERVLEDE